MPASMAASANPDRDRDPHPHPRPHPHPHPNLNLHASMPAGVLVDGALSASVRSVHLALPLPAERSGFALEAMTSVLGGGAKRHRGSSQSEVGAACVLTVPWRSAQESDSLVAAVSRDEGSGIHALIMLRDGGGRSVGEGVLVICPPWHRRGQHVWTPACVTMERERFELALTVHGRLVGTLSGEAHVTWSANGISK